MTKVEIYIPAHWNATTAKDLGTTMKNVPDDQYITQGNTKVPSEKHSQPDHRKFCSSVIQKNYSNQFNVIRINEEKNIIKFTSDNTESYNQPFNLTKFQNSISKSIQQLSPGSGWNPLHPPQRTPNNIPEISSRYLQQYLDLWQYPYLMETSHNHPYLQTLPIVDL